MARNVLIVGGGIIGVACAYELTRRGARVAVLDKGKVGFGCSYGNSGWVVPSFSLPLPMPGAIRKAGKWLLDPASPFYVKPRLDWDLLCWLTTFARFTTQRHLYHAAEALTALAKPSLEFYRQFAASAGGAGLELKQQGLLLVCSTPEGLAGARQELQIVGRFGVPGRELDRQQLHDLEPAITGDVIGGIHFHHDAHVLPLQTVQAIANAAARQGAEFREDTDVIGFDFDGQRIASILTTKGRFAADEIILATGSWAAPMGKLLGLNVPIQPAKGYGIRVEPFDPLPRLPALLDNLKIGVTPHDGYVKLAGTLELAGLDDRVTRRRIEAILQGTRKHYNLPASPHIIEIWRGFRPCAPDGLPIIGRTRRGKGANLIIATGHAMLGVTLAPATANLVADLLEEKTPALDPKPYAPDRF